MGSASAASFGLLGPTLVVALLGCGGGSLGPQKPGDTRKPDGVAIDPADARPSVSREADTGAGLVGLKTPMSTERARATVRELFRRVTLESTDGLADLFTNDAGVQPLAGGYGYYGGGGYYGHGYYPGGAPAPYASTNRVAIWFEQRFRRLDYTKLSGELVYREEEMDVYRASDTLELQPHRAIRIQELGEDDVVVRFPIRATRVGTERLFGEEMVIWLRLDRGAFRIYRIAEDFQLQ